MQGMFWKIDNKKQLEERMENMKAWIHDNWDWSKPLCLKPEVYQNPRSLDQNALFHVWIRQMVKYFQTKMPELTEEEMKDVCKLRFLGTETRKAGKITLENQLRETSKLRKGEMYHFMEEVYQWCFGLGLQLDVPADSEFMRIRKSQA
jgi:hypothetical protein